MQSEIWRQKSGSNSTTLGNRKLKVKIEIILGITIIEEEITELQTDCDATFNINIEIERYENDTYPVMACEHEMIGSHTSVPKGILVGNDINVIADEASYGRDIMRQGLVNEAHHHGYAQGKKMNMGLLRVRCHEPIPQFKLVNESAFCRIDILTRPVVCQRRFPLWIYKYLEMLLHFRITPV
jgi:hypothetical protein